LLADGETPWCFAFESGPASGWPGTDLIESLVLRLGGADVYDDWTFHRESFDSPAVLDAGRFAEELLFEPGFVQGGPGLISRRFFFDPLLNITRRDALTGAPDPDCWLFHQADFMLGDLPVGVEGGTDIDFFPLPPATVAESVPATGGGAYIGVMSDRPEVRALVEFLASPRYGELRAASVGVSGFLSANASFDVSRYLENESQPLGTIRYAVATVVRDAVAADVFRLDASDLMDPSIGGFAPDGQPGAFWQGMLDFVDGVRTIDEVLSDIEAEWVALEAEGGS